MAKEYNISRPAGLCVACQRQLQPGDDFVATVKEVQEELLREDFCPACWQGRQDQPNADILGLWRTKVAAKQEKKRLFVDDELLVSFFERLEGAEEAARLNFRFVLALVLMRKKMLVYDKMDKLPDGRDSWTMHFRGTGKVCSVIDPHMDEEKIAAVSGQLGQVLEGEL